MRAKARAGQQYRRFAVLYRGIETRLYALREGLQLARRNGEPARAFRIGKCRVEHFFPATRQCDDRQMTFGRNILMAKLARQPGTHMLGDEREQPITKLDT